MYVNSWETSKILIILNFQKDQGSKYDTKINPRATQVIYLRDMRSSIWFVIRKIPTKMYMSVTWDICNPKSELLNPS